MQYGPSAGLSNIRGWLSNLQETVHKRAPGDWTVSMGSGSQDLMSKVIYERTMTDDRPFTPFSTPATPSSSRPQFTRVSCPPSASSEPNASK